MPIKILVVDDDRAILDMIKRYLTANGVSVVMTDNGSEALLLVKDSRPDIVLCDAQMPGLDGHALCRALKREAKTASIPVVLMSGERMGDKDVVSGLEQGADDYILKPFSMSVMLARLKAVLRRYEAASSSNGAVNKSGIELDPEGRTVKVGGKSVALTGKEFDLLAVLISKSGRLLSVTYLLETVWGYDPANYNDPGTVEVHISHLRKKLGPRHARHIVNVPGHGYKFDPAPEAPPR
ncbi:MAG: response regulator transcription factor [Elusimicrobia bacterium]|nr:response regulator transcription factor [Elusimicrobiota bacterium]